MPDERPYQEDEIDLFDYVRVIYKYRKLVISIVFISVCFNVVKIKMQPFRYKATATFFPLNVKEFKTLNDGQPGLKPKLVLEDLIISILKSRDMAYKIINELDLKNIWKEGLLLKTQQKLWGATSISLSKGGVIELNVVTEDSELSAKIANSYINNLDNFNKELQLSTEVSLVQIIDHAVPPEERMPRGMVSKSIITGLVSSFLSIFLAFIIEYIKKSGFREKIKTLKNEN